MTPPPITWCACCGQAGLSFVGPYRLTHASHGELFSGREIHRCRNCRLAQIVPRPTLDELDRFYDTAYRTGGFNAACDLEAYPYDSSWKLSRGRALRNLAARHLELAGHECRILDIGAGFGHTLAAFKEVLPSARMVALEGDPTCRGPLAQCGAHMIAGYWGSAEVAAAVAARGPYDVVILSHVLEHVLEPVPFLRSILDISPRAALIIEVPNEGHCVNMKKHSPHTLFFDVASLQEVVQRAGYRTVWIGAVGPPPEAVTAEAARANSWAAVLKRLARAVVRRVATISQPVSAAGSAARRRMDLWRDPHVLPLPVFEVERDDGLFIRAIVRAEG